MARATGAAGAAGGSAGVVDVASITGEGPDRVGSETAGCALTGSGVDGSPTGPGASIRGGAGGTGARATGGRVERTFRGGGGGGGGVVAVGSTETAGVSGPAGATGSSGGAAASAAATGGEGAGLRESLNEVTSSTRPRCTGCDRRSVSACAASASRASRWSRSTRNAGRSLFAGAMSFSAASPAIGIPSGGPSPKSQRAAKSLIPGGRGTGASSVRARLGASIERPRASRVELSTIFSGVRAATTLWARRSPPTRGAAVCRARTLCPSSLSLPATG